MIKTKIFICFLLIASFLGLSAQNIDDTTTVVHSPKKATIMSACLPGLGQIYNKKYWKLPIVYGGMGGAAYSFVWNHKRYKDYLDAFKLRTDSDPESVDRYDGFYTETNLLDLSNYYRRNMEISVIAFVAVYALNIIDAAVDAHLYDFDISDDLSLNVSPSVWNFNDNMASGLTLTIRF